MNTNRESLTTLPQECVLCSSNDSVRAINAPASSLTCHECGHDIAGVAKTLERFRACADDSLGGSLPIQPLSRLDKVADDSLALVELVMQLEEEFDVTIPDEDVEKLETVADAVRYLQTRPRAGESQTDAHPGATASNPAE